MPGPYSTEFLERQLERFVKEGYLSVKSDGSVWRHRNAGTNRPIDPPTRCDYGKRHKSVKFYDRYGEIRSVPVHRLVWQLHHGNIPEGRVINHKDGDPTNNRIENLEVVSQSENIQHSYRVLGHKPSQTALRERYDALLKAAHEAVETADLEALRAFLMS